MIEAEVKYCVKDREVVGRALREIATPRQLVYGDQYFSHRLREIMGSDSELRIRTVSEKEHLIRTTLTYKSHIVDASTESKHEYEVNLESRQAEATALLEAMGYDCYIEFRKICLHFEFTHEGRSIAATIVTLDEAPGTFIEIESVVPEEATDAADHIHWLVEFAKQLGLQESDRTTVTYEETVAKAREGR